ncbi:TolC family protein [Flammeovirga sp. SubArs3]|uniref:TolC family protein n=1 Tax=Flammeovirga sp. SubArs3 TaxID=2995316 RepID=UPI00248C7771|nr:TolC family protein [Flammeovirga sp. SubArs3]
MKNILYILLLFPVVGFAQNPYLDQYIEQALENNYGVQAKSQSIQVIASEKEMIKGKGASNLDLMYGYGASPIETRNGPLNHKISAGIMLPWFGSRATQYEVVDQKIIKAEKDKIQTENSIKYSVRSLYFQMIQNQKDLTSSRDNILILKTFESIALTQYENAKGSLVDVLRVQMQIEDADNNINKLIEDSTLLHQQFELVLNSSVSDVNITDKINFVASSDSNLENNPLLQGMEASQNMIRAEVNSVSKSAAPQIKLGLEYGILGDTQMSAENPGRNTVMPMLGLSIPVFNAKKYSGQKEQLTLSHQTIDLEKQELENVLQAELLKAMNQREDAHKDIELIHSQMLKIEQAIKVQREVYTVGNSQGGAFIELLRLQMQRLDFLFKEHKAESSLNDALAKINFIQGV